MSAADFDCLPNGFILQNYRIKKVLGKGGFGITYLAEDETLHKQVVIKENFPFGFAKRMPDGQVQALAGEQASFDRLRENFLAEARMLAKFDHPNIVPIHHFLDGEGWDGFIMPFLDGLSFKDYIKQRSDHPLSLIDYIGLLEPLLDALDTLHQGKTGRGRGTDTQMAIYHRDIKPENILIVEETSEKITPILIDFGTARNVNSYQNTVEYAETLKFKSGAFTPPEFTENDLRVIGPYSDLYSLGATIYSVITGDPLRDRSAMRDLHEDPQLCATYGAGFLKLIMDATELSIERRPATTDAWRAHLKDAYLEKQQDSPAMERTMATTFVGHSIISSTSTHAAPNTLERSPLPIKWVLLSTLATLIICAAILALVNQAANEQNRNSELQTELAEQRNEAEAARLGLEEKNRQIAELEENPLAEVDFVATESSGPLDPISDNEAEEELPIEELLNRIETAITLPASETPEPVVTSTSHYSGNVGKLEAAWEINWLSDGTVKGRYYYPSRGSQTTYALVGRNPQEGYLVLDEYTNGTKTATIHLNKSVTDSQVIWNGMMHNADGRELSTRLIRGR